MCAISGIIGKNLKDIDYKKILNSLKHRGPDASKFVKLDEAVLMHNRLSIIDINNRSDQPLYSEDNSSVIVFNGEIYNYLELHEELKNFYHFTTQSDTEVILAAYKKWGFHMLDKLFGAFAFCLYDKKKKEAFFARDRFGQKPIFFWKKNNNIYFASEIKGLIAAGYRPKENLNLWSKYLMNGETDNYNNTFFKDIFQLLPGEYGLYRDDNLIVKKWYSLSDRIEKNNENIDFDRAKEKILELLCSSIAITSRSDAKISLSLSGGLDSNLLLSLLKKMKLIKNNFKCYSVYFGKDFSEKKLINDSLGFLKMKTNYINFELEDLFKTIEPVIKSLESPSGGLMNCALYKLTKNAAKDKFKVILDGTGLDEAFGGYEKHHLMYLNDLKRKKSNQFFKNLELFKKNYNIKEELIYKKLST
jgi:asparagine synthase (glutamine-hydrolysing)